MDNRARKCNLCGHMLWAHSYDGKCDIGGCECGGKATLGGAVMPLLSTGNARLKVNRPMGKDGQYVATVDIGGTTYRGASDTIQGALYALNDDIVVLRGNKGKGQ